MKYFALKFVIRVYSCIQSKENGSLIRVHSCTLSTVILHSLESDVTLIKVTWFIWVKEYSWLKVFLRLYAYTYTHTSWII